MGLTLTVGSLAECAAHLDAEDLAFANAPYENLNAVLRDVGAGRHVEPLDLPATAIWSSDMWGYGGLHAIRRLASWHTIRSELPPPGRYEDFAADPVIDEMNARLLGWNNKNKGFRRFFGSRPQPAPFQHLMFHSDSEGFYLPTDFPDVIFDPATPQREGVGAMVGSSPRLLDECRKLAALIALPLELDEEDDDLLDAAETPGGEGWRRYGVEAFGIIRLMRGCENSIATGAVLAFT